MNAREGAERSGAARSAPRADRASTQAGTDDAGTPGMWTVLWAVLGGAVVWALHLIASYVLLAYACTTNWWSGTRTALAIVSALAVAITAWSGIVAWRAWRVARAIDQPHDDAWDARMGERTARVSFLMVVGLVSAIVFGIGIVYEAVTIWFVPLCEPGIGT